MYSILIYYNVWLENATYILTRPINNIDYILRSHQRQVLRLTWWAKKSCLDNAKQQREFRHKKTEGFASWSWKLNGGLLWVSVVYACFIFCRLQILQVALFMSLLFAPWLDLSIELPTSLDFVLLPGKNNQNLYMAGSRHYQTYEHHWCTTWQNKSPCREISNSLLVVTNKSSLKNIG